MTPPLPREVAVALRVLPRRPEPRTGEPPVRHAARALVRALKTRARLALGIWGSAGSGRRRLASALSAGARHHALEIAIDLLSEEPADLADQLAAALGEARRIAAVPTLVGGERLEERERERRLVVLGRVLDAVVWDAPILVIAETRLALSALADDALWLAAAPPEADARARHFTARLTAELADATAWDAHEAARTAALYPLSPGALEAAARDAARGADDREAAGERAGVDAGDLLGAVREQLSHRLANLAEPVRQRLGLDDLVVEPETRARLEELLDYVRLGDQVYDRWGFGQRVPTRGVAALFSGPPGTGKTMAASVLATELGLELYRVDVSRVVSKYIGETEANLGKVFAEASSGRAILLFDEADSLFGKRTADVRGASDRFGNMEVNYLLQKLDTFDGVAILTTNFEAAVDAAFMRRLQFRLRFSPPDPLRRAELWRKTIPAAAPLADDVDFAELGSDFDLAGGHIRNAVVRAAFRAAAGGGAVTHALLVEAAERELADCGRLTTGSMARVVGLR